MAKSEKEKREQALATQKRARQRAIDKANSPEQREKARAKAIASQEKTRAKQQTPEYKAKQKEKAKIAFDKKIAKNKKSFTKIVTRKPIKSKGLAGKSVSSSEKALHNKMAAVGCIACINAGITTAGEGSYVSVHHCDGRTKPYAHEHCLGLCQWHHDTPMTKEMQALYPDVFPIHAKGAEGGKALWEKVNGTQEELIMQLWKLIDYKPVYSNLLHTNK